MCDDDVEKMFNKIKNQYIENHEMIFESPDLGKTVYVRRLGTAEKTLYRSEQSELVETTKDQ